MTVTQPVAPRLLDVTGAPHLQGVFAPTISEVDVTNLWIEGELPPEIDGHYIRNGPNPRFTPLGAYLYPLGGDGMLHRVQIRDRGARYTNRFVRTPALVCEEAAGQALWPGIAGGGYAPGADLVGPVLAHTRKDLPDINIIRHGGRLLALAEAANPFLISPELETLGRETFCGMLPAGVTAHPKIDPLTGDMIVFHYGLSAPYLTWSIIGRNGVPVRAETPIEGVTRPRMIHDMALTARYVVLVLGPLFFDPAQAVTTGSPLGWEPDHGTRIALIPRSGGPTRWLSSDAFWLWHTANAHDTTTSDGRPSVTLDYVRWSSPGGGPVPSRGSLARMRLEPSTGLVTHEQLVEHDLELPRIDDRATTTAHRIIATSLTTGHRDLPPGDADTLGWYDTHTGRFDTWAAGDLAVGEQAYIPQPGDPDPTHGWWTTIATDRTDLTSRLLVLPAEDPATGPVAVIHLPQRVPLGLHGAWLPTEK